jgi:hypothetical protein
MHIKKTISQCLVVLSIVFLMPSLSGCQSLAKQQDKHVLDGIAPDIGHYGYWSGNTVGLWSVNNISYSDNEAFGQLGIWWATTVLNDQIMWVNTLNGGTRKFCDDADMLSGHGALKLNGKWVKSEITCSRGNLLFSLYDKFIRDSIKIDEAVVFDHSGEPAVIYDLKVFFDNTRVINAMKFAHDKSVINAKTKQ